MRITLTCNADCDLMSSVKAMVIRSRQRQTLFHCPIKKTGKTKNAYCNLVADVVEEDDHLDFDIVLSSMDGDDQGLLTLRNTSPMVYASMVRLLSDMGTADIAFMVGGYAVMCHHSILKGIHAFAAYCAKYKKDTGNGEFSTHAWIISLEYSTASVFAVCSMLWYCYTGEIVLEPRLSMFAITNDARRPCRNRMPCSSFDYLTRSMPDKETRVQALFSLACTYDIAEIRDVCRNRLLTSLNDQNAARYLFSVAYCDKELKDGLCRYLGKRLNELTRNGTVPSDFFKQYQRDPQWLNLMSDVVKAMSDDN
ncbi:hypothetical protein BG004_006458 [Podila humilis]|nr:hypothetical protein BG004_006458 [Podila humilis]